MDTKQAILLAILQGITELLPVSSTGHLLLIGEYLNIPIDQGLLVFLHLGTLLAIIIGYSKEILTYIKTKSRYKILTNLIIAVIPAAVFGFLFSGLIEEKLYQSSVIVISLILWGVIMITIDQFFKSSQINSVDKLTPGKSLLTGLFQSIALIPGTSRSGISTIGGVLVGLDKSTALEWAFIVGIPTIFGAFVYDVYKDIDAFSEFISPLGLLILLISTITGVISVLFLKKISKKRFLTIFGIYRIILGVVIYFTLL